ncbi:hypothetical protein HPB47_013595 [Ixodes persulcatus]|uniref:Uncharacterized protein n=1 Tax=Ixodes persulcatus TaxID=34615 RepID=A0AC60R1Q2_IXOPE|nr:hypothetical protein HPB47_013595 [Ixodes persulcatus]
MFLMWPTRSQGTLSAIAVGTLGGRSEIVVAGWWRRRTSSAPPSKEPDSRGPGGGEEGAGRDPRWEKGTRRPGAGEQGGEGETGVARRVGGDGEWCDGLHRGRTFGYCEILPIALVEDAARWWRLQEPPSSMAAFHERFRSEFLPPDYERRVREELNTRTQHPDESLLEYVRAIQELYSRADPAASHSDQVSRVIRQCHPSSKPYLRGRSFDTLEALAREARVVQADLLAELRYAPPPRPEESLEPCCAFAGSQSPTPRVETASVSAVVRRKAREVVSARALDPFSYEHRRRAGRENRPSSSVGAIAAGVRGVPRRGDNASRFGRDDRDGRRQSPGRRPLRCFRCDQPGHIIRNCRSSSVTVSARETPGASGVNRIIQVHAAGQWRKGGATRYRGRAPRRRVADMSH